MCKSGCSYEDTMTWSCINPPYLRTTNPDSNVSKKVSELTEAEKLQAAVRLSLAAAAGQWVVKINDGLSFTLCGDSIVGHGPSVSKQDILDCLPK